MKPIMDAIDKVEFVMPPWDEDKTKAVINLLHAVGKLAMDEGESWRLDHPELMDAFGALRNEVFPGFKIK